MFRHHPAGVGKAFHRRDERKRVSAGREFVVTALAREQRPGSADAIAVESRAVRVLPIAIVIVTLPARTLRQIVFDRGIENRERIDDERIVRIAQSQPNEMKEFSADHVARRLLVLAVRDLQNRGIGFGHVVRSVAIGRRDPQEMLRPIGHEFAAGCDGPFFQMRRQPIRIIERELRRVFIVTRARKFRHDHQAGDDRGQRGWRIPGSFFPAFLPRLRAVSHQITRGAQDQRPRIEKIERIRFVQMPGEQDGRGHFVHLQARPESFAAGPGILRQLAVGILQTSEPDERGTSGRDLTRGQQTDRALHEIARPNQMITAQLIVALRLAPRNAERRHHRAAKRLVLMREQDGAAPPSEEAVIAGVFVEIDAGVRATPLFDKSFAMLPERRGERLDQFGRGALFRSAKGDRDREFISFRQIELGREREISIARLGKFPIHLEVLQILPAVTRADITNRAAREIRRATHDQMQIILPGPDQTAAAIVAERRRVMRAAAHQMRGEKREDAEFFA